jgi:hypothetical protein
LDVAYTHTTPTPKLEIGSEGKSLIFEDELDTWVELELPKVLVYLGWGITVGDYSLTSLTTASNQADFLLVDLEPIYTAEQLDRMYVVSNPVEDYIQTHDLVHGLVHIIAVNHGYSVRGQLLDGDASLILRGKIIRTKKVQVDRPGSESSIPELCIAN